MGSPKQGFWYVDARGLPVRSEAALGRIHDLKVPPAWTEVHIAPSPHNRLQAIGVDGSGRAQYLYHSSFRARRERHKFEKIERFGEQLAHLRRVTSQHLAQPGLGKDKVLATVIRLINGLYFRVGSEAGVKRYRTYGVTTLRGRHLQIHPDGALEFVFDGKHHVHHRKLLVDDSLAAILQDLTDQKDGRLFQYRDAENRWRGVDGRDVNEYIQALTAPEFSAKDFRTWHGTLLVAKELAKIGKGKNARIRRKHIASAVKNAAEKLGNTPAVCRRSYLHPLIVKLYERGLVLSDVPLNGDRIRADQTEPLVEELQLLELFHIGRVLEQRDRERRAHAKPQGPGRWALMVAPPVSLPALATPSPTPAEPTPRPDATT